MLFSSITFLFVFLPVTLVIYYLVPPKMKNIVMLIASLFFYAWGEPVYIILMMLSILLNCLLIILLYLTVFSIQFTKMLLFFTKTYIFYDLLNSNIAFLNFLILREDV